MLHSLTTHFKQGKWGLLIRGQFTYYAFGRGLMQGGKPNTPPGCDWFRRQADLLERITNSGLL
jgi:hypothetical protein